MRDGWPLLLSVDLGHISASGARSAISTTQKVQAEAGQASLPKETGDAVAKEKEVGTSQKQGHKRQKVQGALGTVLPVTSGPGIGGGRDCT